MVLKIMDKLGYYETLETIEKLKTRRTFDFPCRMIICGASETGKTFFLARSLLRGDFDNINLNSRILVLAPFESSLNQNIWYNLRSFGWNITTKLIDQRGLAGISGELSGYNLLIIDDLDSIKGKNRDLITKIFATESHHANQSVVMICHKAATGCPEARNSAKFIVLTGGEDLLTIMKGFSIPKKYHLPIEDYLGWNNRESLAVCCPNEYKYLIYCKSKQHPFFKESEYLFGLPGFETVVIKKNKVITKDCASRMRSGVFNLPNIGLPKILTNLRISNAPTDYHPQP